MTFQEEAIFVFRPHWVLVVRACFLLTLPLVFSWLSFWMMGQMPTMAKFWYCAAIAFLFFTLHASFMYAMSRFHSIWILTNQRLVEVIYLPYVKHEMRSVFVNEIHEIEEKSTGFFNRVLHYGHVRIKMPTVGEDLLCTNVPYPAVFSEVLDAIHQKAPSGKQEIQNLQKELAKTYPIA